MSGDTIAAIATGGGLAAIGIVRVSGPDAIPVADKIFRMSGGGRLINAESRKMYYGQLCDSESGIRNSELLDIGMCTISRKPHSYTGEDTVEFHCHGSPLVLSQVLQVLFNHGVRQALPGEFTKRAFLNSRMDLTQAEAVIDLIEAETPLAASNAAGQLRGAVSIKLESIYNVLIDIMAHFHAVLDYPDEDIDDFKLKNYNNALKDAKIKLSQMLSSFERGRIIRDGVKTAIIGRPNTGKSSLLNALLGYDRAIVTDVPGTTRDTIEEKILIGNVLLRLIDTAGLRDTDELVEKLGVERSMSALQNAGLILLVLDATRELQDGELDVLKDAPEGVPVIVLINKMDLEQCVKNSEFGIRNSELSVLKISALTGEGLPDLEATIQTLFPGPDTSEIGEIITNTRQYEAIKRAKTAISEALTAIKSSLTPDIVLTEVEAAINAIGEVTGKSMREDIISRIFKRFCVGK